MERNLKDEKLSSLKLRLEDLEQEEINLNGKNRKSYETLKFVALVILLICIVFQTCYIKDSLDLGSGAFGQDLDNQTDDDNGPYDLDKNNDNNKKNDDNNENDNINNNKRNNGNVSNKTNKKNLVSSTNVNNQDTNTNTNNGSENVIYNNNTIDDDIITQPVTQEEISQIKIIQDIDKNGTEKKESFSDLSNLEIFKSSEYFSEKLIYPGISGTYRFYIENYTSKNILYKLTFSVENSKNTNIRYKLKRNGQYIVGDSNNYVGYEELTQESLKLRSKMGDIYLLDWKWIEADNDNDTTNPITRGLYKLTIKGEVQ